MARDTAKAAQSFVPIQEVRDGIVVLSDGSLRGVLLASSTNFALKSQEEQQAILAGFQNFLNSLDFTIQIFIQSRELDIRPYVALLEERYQEQTNELLKIQVREYIEFTKNFTDAANVMSKNFFIIVPYASTKLPTEAGFFQSLVRTVKGEPEEKKTTDDFEEQRAQLEQRMSVVSQGLTRTGVRTMPLGTEEVIELFYKIFNPGELEKPIPAEARRQ